MPTTRDLLRRGVGDTAPDPDAYERVLERVRRREHRRRLGAAVVALSTFVVGGTALWFGFKGSPLPPAEPGLYANGRILFSDSRPGGWGGSELVVVNPDSTGVRDLTDTHELKFLWPVWSPDGGRIAATLFGRDPAMRGIFVMDAEGEHLVQLTDRANDEYPTWSPDGTRIAFTRVVPESDTVASSDIFVMNVDGLGIEQVTSGPENDFSPSWSPDGTRLVFTRSPRREIGDRFIPMDIRLLTVDVTTRAVTPLTPEGSYFHPDWSPDGNRIVFAAYPPGSESSAIYDMAADGSGARRITAGLGSDVYPAWSPDGAAIVFERAHDGSISLVTVRLDGSDERVIWTGSDAGVFLLKPDWEPVPLHR